MLVPMEMNCREHGQDPVLKVELTRDAHGFDVAVGTLQFRMIAPSSWLINWMDDRALFYQEEDYQRENWFVGEN